MGIFRTDGYKDPRWDNITEEEKQQVIECYHAYPDKEITVAMIKDLRNRLRYGPGDCKMILKEYIDTLK